MIFTAKTTAFQKHVRASILRAAKVPYTPKWFILRMRFMQMSLFWRDGVFEKCYII